MFRCCCVPIWWRGAFYIAIAADASAHERASELASTGGCPGSSGPGPPRQPLVINRPRCWSSERSGPLFGQRDPRRPLPVVSCGVQPAVAGSLPRSLQALSITNRRQQAFRTFAWNFDDVQRLFLKCVSAARRYPRNCLTEFLREGCGTGA